MTRTTRWSWRSPSAATSGGPRQQPCWRPCWPPSPWTSSDPWAAWAVAPWPGAAGRRPRPTPRPRAAPSRGGSRSPLGRGSSKTHGISDRSSRRRCTHPDMHYAGVLSHETTKRSVKEERGGGGCAIPKEEETPIHLFSSIARCSGANHQAAAQSTSRDFQLGVQTTGLEHA